MSMELNCLPADLVCEILIRIPAKSLLQIRCVCKYWEKCWRKVECVPNWNTPSAPRTVRGVIHRLTALHDHKTKLVSFDLGSDSCSEFACPDQVYHVLPSSEVELSIFRDSLALIHTVDEWKSHIWGLREDGGVKSWVKLFTLDLARFKQSIGGFTKDGLVLMMGGPAPVVEPIVDNPVMVTLELHREYHWHLESYQETLVLLQEGVDIALSPQNFRGDKKADVIQDPVTIIIDL